MKKQLSHIIFLLLLNTINISHAQNVITESQKENVIKRIFTILDDIYINEEIAQLIKTTLTSKQHQKKYRSINKKTEFAEKISQDIRALSKDQHFYVGYDPEFIESYHASNDTNKKTEELKKHQSLLQSKNFTFDKLQVLNGNIGYIKFNYFHEPEYTSDTLASAMQFLSYTDAIIIDLRKNNGGILQMAQLLASYFFNSTEEQLLFQYYYKENGKKIDQSQWVLPSVQGQRYLNKPIYVLTSNFTFSAAEWFSYVMKNLSKATIIGEQTVGGAHAVIEQMIDDDFYINVPFGELKDPTTQTDFEGVGVKPNIYAHSYQAQQTAHLHALKTLAQKYPQKKSIYDWYIGIVQSHMNPIKLSQDLLKDYTGRYGKITINLENDKLYYSWNDTGKALLWPIKDDTFVFENDHTTQFQFIKKDKAIYLQKSNLKGHSSQSKKL